jgi:hypothetical protein
MKVVIESLFILLLATIFVGCVGSQQIVYLSSPFDKDATKKIFENGNNTIKGSALIRQAGGSVVTCAGTEVQLFPATDYAKERTKYLYGNTDKGYKDIQSSLRTAVRKRNHKTGQWEIAPNYIFEPDYVEYSEFTRKTIGDAQGYFEFKNVPDGEYFIISNIVWGTSSVNASGGWLLLRVEVRNGETINVVLAP